jgi:hypothetical protein
LKKKSQKRAGGVAQGVGTEFKPQYRKKKKKREGNRTICDEMDHLKDVVLRELS